MKEEKDEDMNRYALAACFILLSSTIVLCDDASTSIADMTNGKLVDAKGHLLDAPDATSAPIKYYAIYYSAAWCPPCHRFTPKLVTWYNGFKPTHPDFELIFVSEDNDEDAMLGYMKEMSMPWVAVKYRELKHDGMGTFQSTGIEKYAGKGIPDLVLVDANGKVLSDSYQNDQYVGLEKVVEDIQKIVTQ